jgi:hypothetical protein
MTNGSSRFLESELATRTTLRSMPAPSSTEQARKTARTAIARDARRIADDIESIYIRLQQIGTLSAIRKYMVLHQEGVPHFDLLEAAKGLRCYAGVLSMIASGTPQPKPER